VRYAIAVNGRVRQVSVSRAGARFAVTVDGRPWAVDAARIDAQTLSLAIAGPADQDRSYEVTVEPGASGQLVVRVGATPVAVTLGAARPWARRDEAAGADQGPQRIVAPMSGKVVRVLARPGERVRARQPLVVVEAMKMENELGALRDGVVAEVRAAEGMSVDAGVLLVVVE